MAAMEDVCASNVESQLGESDIIRKKETGNNCFEVDHLQSRLVDVKESIQSSEKDSEKEMKILWLRIKTTATLLTYLTSKARILAAADLAHTCCGNEEQEGEGLVDRNGKPMSEWSRNIDLSSFEGPDIDKWIGLSKQQGSLDEQDGPYIREMLKCVDMVTVVMESLVKRVLIAESERATEKEKTSLGQEEIRRKMVQIETMSLKLEEMEKFAIGTKGILLEMRQRVDDLVEETSFQRQRAAENEQELTRVKRDFESLKSYVTSLVSVRETLISSEKQFETIEKLFDRLVAKTTQLEGEKTQKEAEVQKLMEENVRLETLLDKKEAQLLAMNEQCKMMALSASMNSI